MTENSKATSVSRDTISLDIFNRIMSHPSMKGTKPENVRVAISRIHKNNHGITMNGAAYVFASQKGFEIYRYLRSEDKASLQYLRNTNNNNSDKPVVKRKIKTVKVTTDFTTPFLTEANDNAGIYPYIYILENSLRSIIFQKLSNTPNWWTDVSIVADDVQKYATRIQEAEKKYPWVKDRGNHPIYYVGLYELFKIIDKNWKVYFSDVFPDLELLRAWIKESVPIRNIIAHNVKTRLQERTNIEIKTDYICRLITRWHDKQQNSTTQSS